MKEFSRIVFVGFIIAIILFLVNTIFTYTSGSVLNFDRAMLLNFAMYCMYSIPISLVNSYFFDYINTRVNWTETTKKYRLLIGIIGSVSVTIFTVFLVRMVQLVLIEGQSYTEFINSQFTNSKNLTFYFISLLITIVFSVFFHAIYFYKELQKNKVTEQKIIAGTASAQFDALKNQLDPHFLFRLLAMQLSTS